MKNKSLKILVVVESLDIEGASGAKANLALIKNLKTAGFKIEVIHYTRKEVSLNGILTTAIKEKRRSLFFVLSRIEPYLRKHFKLPLNKIIEKKLGFSFTLFNDRNSIISFLRKYEPDNYDLLLTLSQGGSFRPHHAVLKLPGWHAKWMAYIHDPYPMHHFPAPYTWTEPGSMKKEAFVRDISEKAAFSAFPSKLLLEWMGQFYPQFLKTGVIIPHQIADEEIKNKDFPEWFNPDQFNIVHAGNLLWGRDPKGLIEGFKQFLMKFPKAKTHARLIFIGGKNYYSEMLAQKAQKLTGFCVIEKNIPFDMVRKIQNASSVNVILEAKSSISPFLPGKFPHCIVSEKPILLLGPAKSESRRLLGEDYPYWAEIDSSEKIAALIEILYNHWNINVSVKLVRPDLHLYMSHVKLKEVLNNLEYSN